MIVNGRYYVEKLLFETEALEAVWAMMDVWWLRAGRSEEKEFFGLSEPEFHAWVYLVYAGDVGNGGHWQYFLSFGGQSAALAKALPALGFYAAAGIFQRAVSVFPSGDVPADHAKRAEVFDQLADGDFELWGKLDREFYDINMDLWEPLLEYLRKNESQVFQPERKLGA